MTQECRLCYLTAVSSEMVLLGHILDFFKKSKFKQ